VKLCLSTPADPSVPRFSMPPRMLGPEVARPGLEEQPSSDLRLSWSYSFIDMVRMTSGNMRICVRSRRVGIFEHLVEFFLANDRGMIVFRLHPPHRSAARCKSSAQATGTPVAPKGLHGLDHHRRGHHPDLLTPSSRWELLTAFLGKQVACTGVHVGDDLDTFGFPICLARSAAGLLFARTTKKLRFSFFE